MKFATEKRWMVFLLAAACGSDGTSVQITTPSDGALIEDNPVVVTGTADADDGAEVRVIGGALLVTGGVQNGQFTVETFLNDGDNTIYAEVGDKRSEPIVLHLESSLEITYPTPGLAINQPSFLVQGRVRGEAPDSVELSMGTTTVSVPVEDDGTYEWAVTVDGEREYTLTALAQVGGRQLETQVTFNLFFTQPVITSITPSAGVSGTVVTITGQAFGETPENVTVMLGDLSLAAASAEPSHVTFVVPETATIGLNDVVVVHLGIATLAGDFSVLAPGDWASWSDETDLRLDIEDGLETEAVVERIVSGDVDNDGDLDLLLVRGGDDGAAQNLLLINDGAGYFSDETSKRLPQVEGSSTDAEFADIDGDADLDLLVVNTNGEMSFLYENDGAGAFVDVTESRLGVITEYSCDALFGDLDEDGDFDLVFSSHGQDYTCLDPEDPINCGAPTRVFFSNRGFTDDANPSWEFIDSTASNFPTQSGVTLAIHAVDVDRDGDLDIVRNDREDQSNVFINNGVGQFADDPDRLPEDTVFSHSFGHGDLDLDGTEDLFWVDLEDDFDDGVLINDGIGFFEDEAPDLIGHDYTDDNHVTLADFDGDLDLDVYVSSAEMGMDRLYENDHLGTGVFVERTGLLQKLDGDISLRTEAVDVDNDGDLDLVMAVEGSRAVRLYVSHAVQ